ncbi:NAD(P)H-dependent flavin oxidoreductase [Desmospora activa]|uniref:Probable nitronate monooxygenase n=1 Tax=Desmospora activa DSM 45169 TaxID=1121389 RepID=A0A2T4ZBW0_9BACL|nr:nitronate monooxygenase [Desmospora activa]PTM59384.1 nitronate monooxygenase [Desmospora activa DSM 45169]
MNHRLTQLLHIRYPIVQAGMAGGIATPQLAAAVSEAGGLGTLGAGYWNAEQLRQAIAVVRERTARPFAVNLFVTKTPDQEEDDGEKVKKRLGILRQRWGLSTTPQQGEMEDWRRLWSVVRQERVPVVSFAFGRPEAAEVKELQAGGTVVIGTATTVAEAVELEKIGVDALVVQGWEAGGHRGGFHRPNDESGIGLMALLPQVADRVQIPLIAAGGVMDGRGMVAAMVLGASGVQLGTAFLTCVESGAHPAYKQRVLQSDDESTHLTRSLTGKTARGIRNAMMKELESQGTWLPYPLQHQWTQEIRQAAQRANDSEWMSLWAGQASGMSREEKAGELIRRMMEEAETVRWN